MSTTNDDEELAFGVKARPHYTRLLNQERCHVDMLPDPTAVRRIAPSTPAKWAVVQTLSTKVSLSLKDIIKQLEGMDYRRERTALREALTRLVKFGLAVRQKGYRRRILWRLTEHGRQLPLNPARRPNDMFMQTKILDLLKTKTEWVFAADLATELNLDKTAVSGALRKLRRAGHVVKQVIPGHNPRLWATFDNVNNSHVTLTTPAIPPKAPPKPRKRATKQPVVPITAGTPSRSRAFSMCLPNKPTLVQAVTDIVAKKVADSEKFSAHDVTKAIREKLIADKKGDGSGNRQTYVPIVDSHETGMVWVDGHQVAKVEHDDVRDIINHLFNTGAITNYARSHNGTYLEYELAAVATPPDPSVPDPVPARVSTLNDALKDGTDYDGSSII